MNQSTIIFGYLFAAFVVFITIRGELPLYWGFLVSSPKQPSAGPTATGSGAISGSDAASTAETASKIASMAETLAIFV